MVPDKDDQAPDPSLIEETGRSDSWNAGEAPSARDIDLSHVPDDYRKPLRKMLLKYDDMWYGRLEDINVVKYRIYLHHEAKPALQRPYRTGPASRQFVSDEVERMVEDGIIEPAQSEWASPVVIAPKADTSLRFCVDYPKRNAATVRDTYPLSRMDEFIDTLGEATVF